MRLISTEDLARAERAIDDVNAGDPNQVLASGGSSPRALLQGRLAAAWIVRLDSDASWESALAARAHHLRRWEILRADYPEGRAGYHRWKRAARERSRDGIREALAPLGIAPESVDRIAAMAAREDLGTDPGAQLVEDAACLVFLETQYEALIDDLGEERVEDAVRKTLKKMSERAIALAAAVPLSERGGALLSRVASGG